MSDYFSDLDAVDPVDPGWGEPYACSPDRPSYVTPEGVTVWMYRKGQKVRFFDVDGNQVGPQHANVYPAVVWAASERWFDPFSSPGWNAALHAEVAAQLARER